MTAATKIQWRVQTKAKTGNWINRGLFETRASARLACGKFRTEDTQVKGLKWAPPYGFGNTRVVPYVKA